MTIYPTRSRSTCPDFIGKIPTLSERTPAHSESLMEQAFLPVLSNSSRTTGHSSTARESHALPPVTALSFHETFPTPASYLSPSADSLPARRRPTVSDKPNQHSDLKHVMSDRYRTLFAKTALIAGTALLLSPIGALAQATTAPASSTPSSSERATASAKQDRWLHVRVISSDAKGETVRVNVPLELAEKVLPTINHDCLHDGKVKIHDAHVNDVDLHALLDAIRTSKDGEYVTVQGTENDVRVAKESNHLIIHVVDKSSGKKSQVEIKVPMKVIDALLSAGKDELDLVAALHALSAQGDTELVSVKDNENTIKIWLDSKNVSE